MSSCGEEDHNDNLSDYEEPVNGEENFEDSIYNLMAEYFSSHSELSYEDMPEFLEFIGLAEEWGGQEEKDFLWKSFEKHSKNGKVTLESTKKGFGEFLLNQPEERISRISLGLNNNLVNNLAKMNKKEQEKDDNDYVDTTGVDYESTLNETEPEFLRKIYNIFLLLDVPNSDKILMSPIEGIEKNYDFFKVYTEDINDFLSLFSENNSHKGYFKVNKNKYKIVAKAMEDIIHSYKGSVEQQTDDFGLYGDKIQNYGDVLDDINSIEQETKLLAGMIDPSKQDDYSKNMHYLHEIIFLSNQRQNKIDTLRIICTKYNGQLTELQEEFKQLQQQMIEAQNENNEEQVDKLLDEIFLLKQDKEKKYSEIESLNNELMAKEMQIQDLSSNIKQMEAFEESQKDEIVTLRSEVEQLKKDYEIGVNEVLKQIQLEEEKKVLNMQMNAQPQPLNTNMPSNINKDDSSHISDTSLGQLTSGYNTTNNDYTSQGISMADLDDDPKRQEYLELSKDALVSLNVKLNFENQQLTNKNGLLENQIKELQNQLDNAKKDLEKIREDLNSVKSDNMKLNNKVKELSEDAEMNKIFRPSNAFNYGERVSRLSIKGKEEEKKKNDLDSIGISSSEQMFMPSNTNQQKGSNKFTLNAISNQIEEDENEEDGDEIEQGKANFGNKDTKTETTKTFTKSIKFNQTQTSKLNPPQKRTNPKRHKQVTKPKEKTVAFQAATLNKQIVVEREFGEDNNNESSKPKTKETEMLNQLSDINEMKSLAETFTTETKKEEKPKQQTFTTEIQETFQIEKPKLYGQSINVFSIEKSQQNRLNFLANIQKMEAAATENENVKKEKPKRPRSISPDDLIGTSKILPKHDKEMKAKKERNIENDFLKMKSMYQAKVTKPANYIEQKQVTLIPPKQPKDFGSAETYDYLALKYENEVMEMIRGSGTSTSYELFTDIAYMIDPFKKTRTKVRMIIIGGKFSFKELTQNENAKQLEYSDLTKVSISEMNSNLLVLHFSNDIILESLRRTVLLMYIKNIIITKPSIKFEYKDTIHVTVNGKKTRLTSDFSTKNKNLLYQMMHFEGAIKYGHLYKKGQKIINYINFNERVVVLCDVGILYFDDPPKQPRHLIPLTNSIMNIVDDVEKYNRPFIFEILTANGEKHVFAARSEIERYLWMSAIEKVMDEYKEQLKKVDVKSS